MTEQAKRVLVSTASKHGATAEIGTRISEVLTRRGISVTVLDPTGVLDITDYDAVVLGSAVYAGHWLAPAREVARVLSYAEPSPETWLFSSGPVGDPPKPDEEPVDVSEVMETTGARDHRVFAGKIDKSKLSFPERALVAAVGAKEGDYRDWDEIESWAEAIADSLEEAVVMSLTIDYQ